MKTEIKGEEVAPNKQSKISVTYFQRKRRISSYSLEFIFDDVRARLKGSIVSRVRVAPFMSNGFFRRIGIMLDAIFHQGEINHITGDINFAALLLKRKRTIVSILDCSDLEERRGMRGWLLRKIWVSWPAKHCAKVTTISETSRAAILRIAGCEPDKVVIISVAVSEACTYHPKPHANLPPRILQVGASINKNLERVVEAVTDMPCVLAIVGELTEEQREKLDAAKIKCENHAHISHNQLREQYELCDVVIFASTFEGFGMPIVEAQRVGRAVVTSNVASMPEVAGAGAHLVDPLSVDSIRDGIQKVLMDDNYRDSLIKKGLENASRFDADEVANQYLNLYKETLVQANP